MPSPSTSNTHGNDVVQALLKPDCLAWECRRLACGARLVLAPPPFLSRVEVDILGPSSSLDPELLSSLEEGGALAEKYWRTFVIYILL